MAAVFPKQNSFPLVLIVAQLPVVLYNDREANCPLAQLCVAYPSKELDVKYVAPLVTVNV